VDGLAPVRRAEASIMSKLRIEANTVAAALSLRLAFVLGLMVLARPGLGQDKPAKLPPPLIGVVDVITAIEQYPRYIKLHGQWQDKADGYTLEIQRLEGQLQEMQARINVLDEDSEDQRDAKNQLRLAVQHRDYQGKKFNDKMDFERLQDMVLVYEDLDVAIAKVAAARGLTLVLRKKVIEPSGRPVVDLSGREVQARVMAYEKREVLWASDVLDITGDVIKLMQVPLADPGKTGAGQKPAGGDKPSGGERDGALPAKGTAPGGGG
jgi:Skp family chaperone for outer membrane proteins